MSLNELSSAAEVLALIKKNDSSNTGLACKHISKNLLNEDGETPSALYKRASLYRDLRCPTLSGVGKDIDTLLERLGNNEAVGDQN